MQVDTLALHTCITSVCKMYKKKKLVSNTASVHIPYK